MKTYKTFYAVFLPTDVQQNFSSFAAREKFLHFLIIHTAAADSMNLANFFTQTFFCLSQS